MLDTIFRNYDIRGIVGHEFTIDDVYHVAKAIAYYMKSRNSQVRTLALGMDGRVHSAAIKEHMVKGLLESGLDVVFVGVVPTPLVYFALHRWPVDGGLMITASHNGPEYNGIKMSLGVQAIAGSEIQEIKRIVHAGLTVQATVQGTYKELPIIDAYLDYMVAQFSHLIGLEYTMALDCGNGAAGAVLPQLITRMKWSHAQLLCEAVDGTYPNHEADPTVEENMQMLRDYVQKNKTQISVGFDGDCDRMAAVTEGGELVLGDRLLALFAHDILTHNQARAVVCDIKCSSALDYVVSKSGGSVVRSPSGHSNIKKAIKQAHAIVAGELSCHFFFNDRYFGFDDGIYAFLRLLEIMHARQKSLTELLQIVPRMYATPEMRVICDPATIPSMIDAINTFFSAYPGVEKSNLDGLRITYADGWALIRPSNTQPVVCFRFEAQTEQTVHQLQKLFLQALEPVVDCSAFPFYAERVHER